MSGLITPPRLSNTDVKRNTDDNAAVDSAFTTAL